MSRLAELRQRLEKDFYSPKKWWGDDLSILGHPNVCQFPINIRKALAFEKVCKEMPIEIKPREIIVGISTMCAVELGHTFPRYETDEEARDAEKYSLNRKSAWGHHPPYYNKILSLGLEGILKEIEKEKVSPRKQERSTQDFYTAAIICLKAVKQLQDRYVNLSVRLAKECSDDMRKVELLNIANICKKVPSGPAESFHEALQSVWFIHLVLNSTLDYTSLGRMDQYLYPYFSRDINDSVITEDSAREMLGCFLFKFNEHVTMAKEYWEDHFTFGDISQGGDVHEPTSHQDKSKEDYIVGQSTNNWLQNIILGGQTIEGGDATNELSHMIINLVSEFDLTQPVVSLRLHNKSDEAIYETASRSLVKGGGMPAIFNDETIIPGMVKYLKIPIEEARDYSNDGCWETLIYGKTEFCFADVEIMLALESVLNRGKSLIDERIIGLDLKDVNSIETYQEFFECFMTQVRSRIDNAINNRLKCYDQIHKIAPEPFLSCLIDDCIANGRDLTERGARYSFYAILAVGLSHCANSLAVIKQLVYEERKTSIKDIIEALKDNWSGHERLRQLCVNRVPKYGNDDDYVDQIVNDIMKAFCDYVYEWSNKINWPTFPVGIGTFENYSRYGHNSGASPDGRFSQEAFGPNYSPSPGTDLNGPTAVIRSATKFDLQRVNDGSPIDLRMSIPAHTNNSFEGMKALLKSFIHLGGNILGITNVDAKTLREAQEKPEKHASLRVRLGGFSAYFVQLAKQQQEEIIKRTEHGL